MVGLVGSGGDKRVRESKESRVHRNPRFHRHREGQETDGNLPQ